MSAHKKLPRCAGLAGALLAAALVVGGPACGSDGGQPGVGDAGAADAAVDASAVDARTVDAAVDAGDLDPRPVFEVKIRGVGGRVISSPPGIDCTTSCSAHFDPGTSVTLTTQAEAGYYFGFWLGACEKWYSPCTVTMDTSRAVTASFYIKDPPWDSTVGAGDCQVVWADQATKISRCDVSPDDYVVVNKSKRNLALCNRGTATQNYRIGLGFTPVGDKVQSGDGTTPEGTFYFSALVPDTIHYKAFLVSYPDQEDAARGLSAGLITAEEKAAIDAAQDTCGEPPSSTELGGQIEIHGGGEVAPGDWTSGCVAISDSGMDVVLNVLAPGDTIVILP